MAEKRSLREQGPLSYIEPTATPDDILGRPEDQARAQQGELLDPRADFERGLQQAALGIQSGELHRAADYARKEGDLESEERLRRHAFRLDSQAQDYAPRVSTYKDVRGLGDAIDYAQGGLGQAAPSILMSTGPGIAGSAVGAAVGAPLGPLGMAAGASIGGLVGGGYQAFKMGAGEAASSQQGDPAIKDLPVEQRIFEQNRKGVEEMLLEHAVPAVIGGRLFSGLSRVFKALSKVENAADAAKVAQSALRRTGRAFLEDTVGEAATEGLQTQRGQASLSRLNPNRDTGHDLQELIDATIFGALSGSAMSLGTSVPSGLMQAGAAKAKGAGLDVKEGINNAVDQARRKIRRKGVPGEDIPDDTIGPGGQPPVSRDIPDSDIGPRPGGMTQEEFDRLDPYGPEFYGPEGPMNPGDGTGSTVTPDDVDLDIEEVRRKLGPDEGKDIPDEEIGRQSRIRKSMLGVHTAGEAKEVDRYNAVQDDFELKTKYEADAEEITGLRELKSITKEESKGQSRRVARNPTDVEAFLQKQVKRGVITQEVADSATVEPLGQRMKREGASEQEMENELAAIVRDLLTRIHNTTDKDFKKGLTSELERLPIDVQRLGEKNIGENDNVEYTVEDTVQFKPGVRKDAKQGDLFPDDRPYKKGLHYAVPLKQFKKNHFGLSVTPMQSPQQMELALRSNQTSKVLEKELAALEAKKRKTKRDKAQIESLKGRLEDLTHNPDPTRRDLLARALDHYVAVLASDAADTASAATEQDTKAGRASLDKMTEEERKAAGKVTVAFRLKNGQTRNLDMDDMINNELRNRRDEVQGNLRNESQIREAAFRSAVAAELLRGDIEGILDQSTGGKPSEWSVAKGSRVEDLLGDYIEAASVASSNRTANQAAEAQARGPTRGIVGKAARERRDDHPFIRDLKDQAINDRQRIQRAFTKAKAALGKEAREALKKAKSLATTPEASVQADEALRAESKVRKQQIKSLKDEAKRIRKVLEQVDKLHDEQSYLERVKQLQQEQGLKKWAAYQAVDQMLTQVYGEEVTQLLKNFPQKTVARFRADRLSALANHLQELDNEMQREMAETTGKENMQVEQTFETRAREAEEQTGAGDQLKVGTSFRGAQPSKKLPSETATQYQRKLAEMEKALAKSTEQRDLWRLLVQALGYKSVADGVYDSGGPVVMLGKLAKGRIRDLAIDAGIPVVGTRELLSDESPARVTVLAAHSEMDKLTESTEFKQLMSAHKEIVTLTTTPKFAEQMGYYGYYPKRIGGMTVWRRDLSMHPDTRHLASEGVIGVPLASMSQELQSDLLRWSIMSNVGEAVGKMAKKAKDAAESQAAEAAKKWILAQVKKGMDIEVLYDKLKEKIANSEGPVRKAWEKVLEWLGQNQQSLVEEIKKAAAEIKATGSEAIIRQLVRRTWTVDVAVREMMATGAYGLNDKTEAGLRGWVEHNYDNLVEIIVRREMLNRTAYMEHDSDFFKNRPMQAKFLRNLLGPEVAKRVAILSKADKAKLDRRLEILLDGKVFTQGMFKDAPRHVQSIMWYMRNVAPNQQTTLDVSAYFNDLAINAMEIIEALGGKPQFTSDQRFRSVTNMYGGKGQIDSVTNQFFGESVEFTRWYRDDLIKELFGAEHIGKSWDQLMDVPLKLMPDHDVWAADALISQAKRRREAYLEERLSAPGAVKRGTKAPPFWMSGMTLRAAIDADKWLDGNIDKLDIQFTQDDEKLKGMLAPGNGSLGLYSPSDDRIFLMPGAMRNRFTAGWTAWHELYHRGIAVDNHEMVTQVLEEAAKNPTIEKIAIAIGQERTLIGDHNGSSRLGAIEEALVELGAAIEHNNFEYLEKQYGVKISEHLKKPYQELWEEFKQLMLAVMKRILQYDPKYNEMKSDLDVLRILRDARNAALGSPTDRKGAMNAAFARHNVNPSRVRLSRQTQSVGEEVWNLPRAEREETVLRMLANMLGDRINVLFEDITGGQDSAGSFDWKTATIRLALNTTHWRGTARHEAFHAFFQRLAQLDQGREVYNRLLKASRAPHVKAQLRKLLADQPLALEQLKNAEERLAYMFQFFATGQLKLNPDTQGIFRRWAKKLGKIVGYISAMDHAEEIFSLFNGGMLKTDEQIATMMRRQRATKLTKVINEILVPTKGAILAVLTSATDRLRHTNNTSLTRIADLFWKDPKAGGDPSFITLRGQREAQFMNWFNDTLDKYTQGMPDAEREEYLLKVLDELQGQKRTDDPLVKALRSTMKRMYFYLADTDSTEPGRQGPNSVRQPVGIDPTTGEELWNPIEYEGENYFPRIWDLQTLERNWEQFVRDVEEAGGPGAESLQGFLRALRSGDGMLEIGNDSPAFDAAMRAINSRTFTFITAENAHKFSKYQQKDLSAILTTYARQAAHRGEATRQFGYKNQVLDELLKDAAKEGATKQELEMAEKAIRALHGTLGHEAMTPMRRGLMLTAMTAVNFAVLPLALFSSLVDPLGVYVRTGDFNKAMTTFKISAQTMWEDIKKATGKGDPNAVHAERVKLARLLGAIEQEQILSVIGDSYHGMFMGSTLKRWNERFFKAIGLDSWTKGTRIGAMVAIMDYMQENHDNADFLAEVGLEPGDIVMDDRGTVEIRPSVLGEEKARRVQAAIYRMIDEAILRPTAGQRPIYMSDMRFMLLGHLKQFTFSFHNTIVKQVAKNVSEQVNQQEYLKAVTQLGPLLMYVPFMMAADMLRSIVGGRIDDEDREPWEFFADSVQRSGVMGVGTFALDAADDFAYSGVPINTMFGPVIHKGGRLIEAAFDPDERFVTQATRMLPGYAFWKGWME